MRRTDTISDNRCTFLPDSPVDIASPLREELVHVDLLPRGEYRLREARALLAGIARLRLSVLLGRGLLAGLRRPPLAPPPALQEDGVGQDEEGEDGGHQDAGRGLNLGASVAGAISPLHFPLLCQVLIAAVAVAVVSDQDSVPPRRNYTTY